MADDVDNAGMSLSMSRASRERLEWLLGVSAAPDEVTFAEFARAYTTSRWEGRWTIEGEYERVRTDPRIVRPFSVESTSSQRADESTAVIVGADEKRWAITCWVDEEPPHLITGTRCIPAPPAGTTIREATEADASVLAALERRSPLRLGETLMTFDRGEDYFASARLMEEVTIYVAEVDGAVIGVYWGAQQPVLVSGEPKRLFLEHHVRIDPETRRGGVFWALCAYGRDVYARTADSIAFYVSPDNAGVRRFVEGTPSWSVEPLRTLLPCAPSTSPDASGSRDATRDDAELIVELINSCHTGEELFVPYTVESLSTRVGRSPDQYDWSNFRIDGAGTAVVGIGKETVAVTKERGDDRTETRRAHVLDHGFAPGADSAYRDLLRACCAELAGNGVTHLAAFTSAPSATHDVLTELASDIEPFGFWAFNIEEPPGLSSNGHYVDPVYF